MGKCVKEIDWSECYGEGLAALNKSVEFSVTLMTLYNIKKADPKTQDCHLIAHRIALDESSKEGDIWKKIISVVAADDCSGGFFHGALEGLILNDPDFKLNGMQFEKLCSQIPEQKYISVVQSCIHMLGHISVIENNTDIPSSIDICNSLPDAESRYNCYGGVFHESINRDSLVLHGLAQKLDCNTAVMNEQMSFCSGYKNGPAQACWQEVSHFFICDTLDPKDIYNRCNKAPNEEYRLACYLGIVGDLPANPQFDMFKLGQLCDLDNDNAKSKCIRIVVDSLLNLHPEYKDRAVKFCRVLSGQNQFFCNEQIKANSL